ncbi:MAG: hypothetical protein D6725_11970, partial [Planctomycetota bacterium]
AIRPGRRLPPGDFDIIEIDLSRSRKMPPDFWKLLPACQRLRRLNLHGTPTTDGDIAALRDLTSLRSLDLSATSITDRATITIPWLRNLEELDLSENVIANISLLRLAAMPRLRSLALRKISLSPYALPLLGSCRSLRVLDLRGVAVAPSAIEKFRQQVPDCRILLDDGKRPGRDSPLSRP